MSFFLFLNVEISAQIVHDVSTSSLIIQGNSTNNYILTGSTSITTKYVPAIGDILFYNTTSNRLNMLFVGVKLTKVIGMKEKSCPCLNW